MTTQDFDLSDYLIEYLNKMNWSQADLAKRAQVSKGIISRIINRERKATPETLQAIAKAMKLPVEEVFRWAGLLPKNENQDQLTVEAEFLLLQLPLNQRRQAIDFIRFLAEQKGDYVTETMEKDEHP